MLYGVLSAVAQDLSGTQDGGALDVVHAAEFLDGCATFACDGGECFARLDFVYLRAWLLSHLLNLLLLEGFAFCLLLDERVGSYFVHFFFAAYDVVAGCQHDALAAGAEKVEVAFDVTCLEVEEFFGVDELSEEACLEVQMRTRRASGVAAESDGFACFDDLVGLDEVLAHVAINGFEAVGMSDDNVVAVASAFVANDAHFA